MAKGFQGIEISFWNTVFINCFKNISLKKKKQKILNEIAIKYKYVSSIINIKRLRKGLRTGHV